MYPITLCVYINQLTTILPYRTNLHRGQRRTGRARASERTREMSSRMQLYPWIDDARLLTGKVSSDEVPVGAERPAGLRREQDRDGRRSRDRTEVAGGAGVGPRRQEELGHEEQEECQGSRPAGAGVAKDYRGIGLSRSTCLILAGTLYDPVSIPLALLRGTFVLDDVPVKLIASRSHMGLGKERVILQVHYGGNSNRFKLYWIADSGQKQERRDLDGTTTKGITSNLLVIVNVRYLPNRNNSDLTEAKSSAGKRAELGKNAETGPSVPRAVSRRGKRRASARHVGKPLVKLCSSNEPHLVERGRHERNKDTLGDPWSSHRLSKQASISNYDCSVHLVEMSPFDKDKDK
ncbi:hypothetical protein HD554DRAFT_2039820 [Boletus coccyginus]|nr:hypothetical protein HD554DRAFT_2039820 [Boletus coccyginus]